MDYWVFGKADHDGVVEGIDLFGGVEVDTVVADTVVADNAADNFLVDMAIVGTAVV